MMANNKIVMVIVSYLGLTIFLIQPFQRKTNSCLLMLPSPETLKIMNISLILWLSTWQTSATSPISDFPSYFLLVSQNVWELIPEPIYTQIFLINPFYFWVLLFLLLISYAELNPYLVRYSHFIPDEVGTERGEFVDVDGQVPGNGFSLYNSSPGIFRLNTHPSVSKVLKQTKAVSSFLKRNTLNL